MDNRAIGRIRTDWFNGVIHLPVQKRTQLSRWNDDPAVRCTFDEGALLDDVTAVPLFASIGAGHTRLDTIDQTRLDEAYVLVETKWITDLTDTTGQPDSLRLASTFILRREDESFTIVFYLNHQDITAVIQNTRGGANEEEGVGK